MNSALFELLQLGKGDPLVHALRHHDFLQGLNSAGCADANLPAVFSQLADDRTQHFAGSMLCRIEIILGQATIAKKALQPGDATHRKTK